MYWALVRVSAGAATVVMAMVPLITLLMAAGQRLEQISWRGVVGATLAVAGITWMTLAPGEMVLPVTAQAVIGAALVVLGVWFGALSPRARSVAAPSVP